MTISFREKNMYGKYGICGCSNTRTRSFCQHSLCAELDSNGEIINRGQPINRVYNSPGDFSNFMNVTPHRIPSETYDNHENPSRGHRTPCNLQLEIYNASNGTYCTDCEDLNGIYDSVYYYDGTGSSGNDIVWFWPLCNPDKIGNTCGASFATGRIIFDTSDGFDLNSNGVRDIFFEIVVYSQGLIYSPLSQSFNASYPQQGYSLQPLTRRMTKIGEIQYRKFESLTNIAGYYDSNVNCTTFEDLEINDEVEGRGLCNLSFKITSKNEDDMIGVKKTSHIHQMYTTWYGFVSSQPPGPRMSGMRYNYCENQEDVPSPADSNAGSPVLTNEFDPRWDVTRVFERMPSYWKVTISGATGAADPLNGIHYLYSKGWSGFVTDGESQAHSIDKILDYHDNPIQTETEEATYEKIACNCNSTQNICISSIVTEVVATDESMSIDLSIGTSLGSIRYLGTTTHSTHRNFIVPATLTFSSGPSGIPFNLNGLTITFENGNEYEDLTQLPCYLVPRNPDIKGGKEPDAWLIEFPDSWTPGYLPVQRPVYVPPGEALGSCDAPGGITKELDDCYMCNVCTTNCANQDWSGPVGSFILTKTDISKINFGGELTEAECFKPMTCNNASDYLGDHTFTGDSDLMYAYKNGYEDEPCKWSSIILRVTRTGPHPCDPDQEYKIGIAVFVDYSTWYTVNPEVTYCADIAFLANSFNCRHDNSGYTPLECTIYSHDEDFAGRCLATRVDCNKTCINTVNGWYWPAVGTRYFYANLPTTDFENFHFADLSDTVNGYDLTWYNNEYFFDEEDGCSLGTAPAGFTFPWRDLVCTGEETPSGAMPLHATWGGGTIKVTPIYNE